MVGFFPDFISLKLWQDFKDHRNKLKAAMTTQAQKLILNKIKKLSNGDSVAAQALIEQSIERGWKGIFPLGEKEETKEDVLARLRETEEDLKNES